MITWMQRHKKWLIITIWISTIAFIGAGFVGWGQYKYGDKAGAVAKVGDIEISLGELQKEYSTLYARYNQIFQGNFDQEKAKQFGVKKQALQQLIQKAMLINLAQEYKLAVSDEELLQAIQGQKVFYNNGVFDKNLYKQILAQNRLSVKEYETSLRKELLIQKLFSLLPVKKSASEQEIIDTLFNIADKIKYKILSADGIQVSADFSELEKFYKTVAQQFKTEKIYEVVYITQKPLTQTYTQEQITQYYNDNKTHFRAADGKILPLEKAHDKVIQELNAKATKKAALKQYISFKKQTDTNATAHKVQITQSNNQLGDEAFNTIASLTQQKPYAKPVDINGTFYIFKLVAITPSRVKTFKEAKDDVLPLFLAQQKEKKLLELAKKSVNNFEGTQTDFITLQDHNTIKELTPSEAQEFLGKLFMSDKKQSFITLSSGKIVLYSILEQKLLSKTNNDNDTITKVKGALFNEGLLKTLQNKYQTEIFIKGL